MNISLKFVPKGQISNTPALVQIMAWRQLGDKPLSESMMFSLLTATANDRVLWCLHLRFRLSYPKFFIILIADPTPRRQTRHTRVDSSGRTLRTTVGSNCP